MSVESERSIHPLERRSRDQLTPSSFKEWREILEAELHKTSGRNCWLIESLLYHAFSIYDQVFDRSTEAWEDAESGILYLLELASFQGHNHHSNLRDKLVRFFAARFFNLKGANAEIYQFSFMMMAHVPEVCEKVWRFLADRQNLPREEERPHYANVQNFVARMYYRSLEWGKTDSHLGQAVKRTKLDVVAALANTNQLMLVFEYEDISREMIRALRDYHEEEYDGRDLVGYSALSSRRYHGSSNMSKRQAAMLYEALGRVARDREDEASRMRREAERLSPR